MSGGIKQVEDLFRKLRLEGKTAFIPYICAGDPSLDVTRQLVFALERAGSDILELGVPFSDPIADGPTIQRATGRALKAGTNLREILSLVEGIRGESGIPIFLMTYYNPPFRYGLERFCRDAASVGVDGLIIPDLPPEEAIEYLELANKYELATVFLAAPTSSPDRLRLIASASSGFIYCVSITGVTGARERLSDEIGPMVERLRGLTDKPIGVGFGISNPEHVKEVGKIADAAIVGSAIIRTMEEAIKSGRDPIWAVERFASSLAEAAHQ